MSFFVDVGFIPIRGSSSGKRPVVGPSVVKNRSGGSISNGGLKTRTIPAALIRGKRQSTERAPTTSVSIANTIPTTCGATRLSFENGVSN